MMSKIVIGAYTILTVIVLGIYVRLPGLFFTLVQEDQLVEWVTFWCYFAASLLFLVVFYYRHAHDGKFEWFFIFLALGCFFVAGEEISWGQRLIGFGTPEVMARYNYQNEFNFHNLGEWGRNLPRRLYMVSLFLYLIVLPYLRHVSGWIRTTLDKWGVAIPPKILIVPFFCSLSLPLFAKVAGTLNLDVLLRPYLIVEVMEMFSGFVFIHFSAIEYVNAKRLVTHNVLTQVNLPRQPAP